MLKLDEETKYIPLVTCTSSQDDEETQDESLDPPEDVFCQPAADAAELTRLRRLRAMCSGGTTATQAVVQGRGANSSRPFFCILAGVIRTLTRHT